MVFTRYENEELLQFLTNTYKISVEIAPLTDDYVEEGDLMLADLSLKSLFDMNKWESVRSKLLRLAFISFNKNFFVKFPTSMRSRMFGSHIVEYRVRFGNPVGALHEDAF